MAYDARNLNFPDKNLSRVKYDLEYSSGTGLYRFKGKPQEVIKIADVAATNVFFDNTSNYDQIWFDSSLLNYNYGDQIFFDVNRNKNLIVLFGPVVGDCLNSLDSFVNNPA